MTIIFTKGGSDEPRGLLDTSPSLQVRPDGHVALAKMDTSPSLINYFFYIKCLILNVISINLPSPQYFSAYLTYAKMYRTDRSL